MTSLGPDVRPTSAYGVMYNLLPRLREKQHRSGLRQYRTEGVPSPSLSVATAGVLGFDNLKPAVIRILKGRDRTEAERFVALRSHYLLTELVAA